MILHRSFPKIETNNDKKSNRLHFGSYGEKACCMISGVAGRHQMNSVHYCLLDHESSSAKSDSLFLTIVSLVL